MISGSRVLKPDSDESNFYARSSLVEFLHPNSASRILHPTGRKNSAHPVLIRSPRGGKEDS